MATDEATSVMEALHRRLSVALVAPSQRPPLARAAAAALGTIDVLDLTPAPSQPITRARLLARSGDIAAERAAERGAELRQLEVRLRDAFDARERAAAARQDLLDRRGRCTEGAQWCEEVLTRRDELQTLVRAATDHAEARRVELRAVQHRLDRVLEQRALAAAAVQDATSELELLDGASLDESGLRRQLEAANRAAQEAAHAYEVAERRCAALLDERRAAAAELEAAVADAERFAARARVHRVDDAPVRAALTSLEDAALFARPDEAARQLANTLRVVEAQLATLPIAPPDQTAVAELERACATADELRAVVAEARARARAGRLSAAERAEIDEAHRVVLLAEERASGGFGRSAARRSLETARAGEQAVLERFGFESYMDVVLSGGQRERAGASLLAAEAALDQAHQRAEVLRVALVGSPEAIALTEERVSLLRQARELLRVDPGDRVVELLEAHVVLPAAVLDDLAVALAAVGVTPAGVSLAEAAAAWLDEHARHDDAATAAVTLDGLARRREALTAQLAELDRAIERARLDAAEAGQSAAGARRAVGALELELTTRTGEDGRRLERVVAAEQLRAQVAAVEATLAGAEADARARLDEAAAAASQADAALDRAEGALTEASRRARRLADALPPEHVPELGPGPLEGIERLRLALAEEAARIGQALPAGDADLAAATAEADEAATAVSELRAASTGAPTPDDVARAAAELAAGDGTGVAVLDDPLCGATPLERDRVLEALLAASARRPVLLLTDDAEILGWAIALPEDLGAVVTAHALAPLADLAGASLSHPVLDAVVPGPTAVPHDRRENRAP